MPPTWLPHPKRGRDNHPAMIGYTYDFVAEQKGLDTEELTRICADNLKTFLKLD